MRATLVFVAFAIICLATTGCWFFFFTVPSAQSVEALDRQFGRFVRDISVRPWHNAVAVAKDAKKWAWGGAWSEPDGDAARKAALLNCVSERARHGVDAPCQIYSVDGQIAASQQGGTRPYVKPVDVECSSIEAPKLRHRVEPRYPEDVRIQRLQGAVIVQGILGTDGIVSGITVLQSPSKTLSDLAVEAVRQWRYTPAYCNDLAKPIRVHLTVTSTFRLNQK